MLSHVQIDSNPQIPAEVTHFQKYVMHCDLNEPMIPCRCLCSIAISRTHSLWYEMSVRGNKFTNITFNTTLQYIVFRDASFFKQIFFTMLHAAF